MKIVHINIFYRWLFALIPAIDGLVSMIYCHVAIVNGDITPATASLIGILTGTSLTSLLYGIPSSKLLGYCWIHRALIWYSFALTVGVHIQHYWTFGVFLLPMRVLMLVIGVFLFYKWFNARCWHSATKNGKHPHGHLPPVI